MSKREKLLFRVVKGGLQPADGYTQERLRAKSYKVGDVLSGTLSKRRISGFNRLMHKLGMMVAENVEGFSGLDGHRVLKRLQIESGVACEVTAIKVPGYGMMEHRTPLSLSFDSMDQGEFWEAARGMCKYIAETYWPSHTPEEIEKMAELMPDDWEAS